MNWFRRVQQSISKLKAQNTGQKTTYIYREQRIIGVTENFAINNVVDGKMFIKMPRTSMYIDVGEVRALRDLLSASLKDGGIE